MSTIMNALRKVEGEKSPPVTMDLGELDRSVVGERAGGGGDDGGEPPEERSRGGRVAVVAGAVIISGLVGVGVTLAALSLWQANETSADTAQETPAVSAGENANVDANVAAVDPLEAELEQKLVKAEGNKSVADGQAATEDESTTVVVVAADILNRNAESDAASTTPASGGTPSAVSPAAREARKPKKGLSRRMSRRQERMSRLSVKPAPVRAEPRRSDPLPVEVAAPVVAAPVSDAPVATARVVETGETPVLAQAEVVTPEPDIAEAVSDMGSEFGTLDAEIFVAEPDVADFDEYVAEPEQEPVHEAAREPLPKFAINGTTWHPHQRRRFAEISFEGEAGTQTVKLREGETLGPLKLKEIGPTGVTFVHDGVEMKRRIGSGMR